MGRAGAGAGQVNRGLHSGAGGALIEVDGNALIGGCTVPYHRRMASVRGLRGMAIGAAAVGLLEATSGCVGTSSACDCAPPMDTRYLALPSALPAAAAAVHTAAPCSASLLTNEVVVTAYPGYPSGTCSVALTLANGDMYAATVTVEEYSGGCCGSGAFITNLGAFLPRE